MLENQWSLGKFLCVGLDSDFERIPEHLKPRDFRSTAYNMETVITFNRSIIQATYDIAGMYKPNIAFYEQYGNHGLHALQQTIATIRRLAPKVPVILDAKRADIGNTNKGYAKMAFEYMDADAITVNPYFGKEALQPFLDWKDKGIIVLCLTSNKGADEFQKMIVNPDGGNNFTWLYQFVAERVSKKWNENNNCALVVGATHTQELGDVRNIVGDMPILIPGIGTQGGNLKKTVEAGKDSRGMGMMINSSSSIIFASDGKDYVMAARDEALKLDIAIADLLAEPCITCGRIKVRTPDGWRCRHLRAED